jgi:TPR repeat protein
MKYLRMAVDSNCFFAEYEYSNILKRSNMKLSREYLERAAKHGSSQAQYELGKILFSEGKREEAREWFERSAQNDAWTQTSVGILLCYEYKDYEKGKGYIHSAIEQ